jgi:hypothetical protein
MIVVACGERACSMVVRPPVVRLLTWARALDLTEKRPLAMCSPKVWAKTWPVATGPCTGRNRLFGDFS